jgi:hypothetical protein
VESTDTQNFERSRDCMRIGGCRHKTFCFPFAAVSSGTFARKAFCAGQMHWILEQRKCWPLLAVMIEIILLSMFFTPDI